MEESVFIVVPAYNEARVIRSTLAPLLQTDYAVVLVDDGSQDDTWSIAESLPIYALRHPINLGQGAALQTGMTFALAQGAAIIVHFDADGQHRVEDIETLIEPLRKGEADVVLGSRFLRAETTKAIPLMRRMLLRGAILINGLTTGLWLSDAHNGFRAMTREAATKIYLRENSFAHASEILLQIRHQKLRYVECPTNIIYSEYSQEKGQSNLNAINILIDLLIRKVLR